MMKADESKKHFMDGRRVERRMWLRALEKLGKDSRFDGLAAELLRDIMYELTDSKINQDQQ